MSTLTLDTPLTVLPNSTVGNAVKLMKDKKRDQIAVISKDG